MENHTEAYWGILEMYISDQKSLAWKKSLEVVCIYVSMNSKRYR